MAKDITYNLQEYLTKIQNFKFASIGFVTLENFQYIPVSTVTNLLSIYLEWWTMIHIHEVDELFHLKNGQSSAAIGECDIHGNGTISMEICRNISGIVVNKENRLGGDVVYLCKFSNHGHFIILLDTIGPIHVEIG